MRAHDAGIERLVSAMVVDRAAEREAQEGAFIGRVAPQVGADQGLRCQAPRGFLAGFTDSGGDEGFPVFKMAGGLIQDQVSVDALFDDEKPPVAFHDRSDRDLRFPAHGMAG